MSNELEARRSGVEVAKGIACCLLLNGVLLGIAWLLLRISDFFFGAAIVYITGYGVLQLIYVIPLILVFQRKGRPDFVKGITIGASIALLLNATCFGLVMTGKIRILN